MKIMEKSQKHKIISSSNYYSGNTEAAFPEIILSPPHQTNPEEVQYHVTALANGKQGENGENWSLYETKLGQTEPPVGVKRRFFQEMLVQTYITIPEILRGGCHRKTRKISIFLIREKNLMTSEGFQSTSQSSESDWENINNYLKNVKILI